MEFVLEGAIDLHHRDQLDGHIDLAILYAVGAPGMSETKTKQVRGASKVNTLQCLINKEFRIHRFHDITRKI